MDYNWQFLLYTVVRIFLGFEVRLYNALYKDDIIGKKRIVQGQIIGTRLVCDAAPDGVFMEVILHYPFLLWLF